MNKAVIRIFLLSTLIIATHTSCFRTQNSDNETLSPLINGIAPQTFDELWKDFDPRKEPLNVEILHEWEEEDVIMKVLRYRIGIFKGQKAMMAAIYGYPKGGSNLPGLVQIHGGGQYADYRAVLTNAKRGYASISISWAGRINAPDYRVTPDIVKLFWENKKDNPDYKIITDWGALDAYHAPCRNPENSFGKIASASWTIDMVESPRNSSWFLCTVGARRALTFLEQQPEVDADRLGVYGHSMGGKLTVLAAGADNRIKAAAPSCGGISNNDGDAPYQSTLADDSYLSNISCPIIFLSPTNDFHGHLQDLPKAVDLIKTQDWRVVSSAHHSHQDHGEFEVTGLLWFDQYLKGTFNYPETPKTVLKIKTLSGIPSFTVTPDVSMKILEVDIYYTQQGEGIGDVTSRDHRKNRFWHHAKAERTGNSWKAYLPLENKEMPLWAYANVSYSLDEPVTGAGYYYRIYTAESFNLSSLIQVATPEQLSIADSRKTMKPSLLIEDFEGDWQKEWFSYKPSRWELETHKLYCDLWKAPQNAILALEVKSAEANKMVLSMDSFAKEVQLDGGNKWQEIKLSADDFQNAEGDALKDWSTIMAFKLSANESYRKSADGERLEVRIGGIWKGKNPEFRNLRWQNR